MKKILIVDDDLSIGNLLEETLTGAGYCTTRAYSGTEALLSAANTTPDLVLLDLMLPGLSGEELLPKLKGIPVIVLSAKVDVDNKVNLLLGGAADYVTKPFHTKELLARIAVQLRQPAFAAERDRLMVGELSLHTDTHMAVVCAAEVKLTPTEAARNSTGLGLSIARTLVEQMHGEISASYEDNRLHIRVLFPVPLCDVPH